MQHVTQASSATDRSEEHTSELQSPCNLVCRLLLEKKNDVQADQVRRLAQLRPAAGPPAVLRGAGPPRFPGGSPAPRGHAPPPHVRPPPPLVRSVDVTS